MADRDKHRADSARSDQARLVGTTLEGAKQLARASVSLLQTVDVLTLHVPQTPETADLMTEERIRMMKKGSLLFTGKLGAAC